jgi:Kef-type K+ transport system membrane component KefB
VAGAVLRLVDRDMVERHPQTRVKLDAVGYGFLVPVFFVASGLRFDLGALTQEPSVLARVPVFVAALLLVRGLPALLYRPLLDRREVAAAAFLQPRRCRSSWPPRRSGWPSTSSRRGRPQR